VRHVQHEQRLHAVIRKAFPGFGESDVAESARMTDEAAVLLVMHGRRVLRPALFLASAAGGQNSQNPSFELYVFDGVSESRQVDRPRFGQNNNPVVIIICGVTGVGKTTIGQLLAQELEWEFYDADDFHSVANIAKMKAGVPLTDEDREPWLDRLRELIEQCLLAGKNAVLACSALKKAYRDRLRVSEAVKFVFLRGNRRKISQQLQHRHEHFMNTVLLDSQFEDLEEPQLSEHALSLELGRGPGDLVELIKTKLKLRS
jgi:gluconokinase